MKKLIAFTLLMIAAVCFWYAQRPVVVAVQPKPAVHDHNHDQEAAAESARAPASLPQRSPQQVAAKLQAMPSKEREAITTLISTLSEVGTPDSRLPNLVEHLQKTGQEPLVVRDANPDSGEMIIVRTKSPLPGTRYFHAQYFTGEDGERFVQHMSFEFKPGPDAMANAVALVEKTFPNLSRPKVARADFYKWDLDNKYIVWVKRMNADDLRDDPFNAYTLQDDGTIRVAVELEIHGD